MCDTMKITGGYVEVEGGTVSGIGFIGCEVTVRGLVTFQECEFDAKSRIVIEAVA